MTPGAEASVIYVEGMHHSVGDLAEVLDNLGVFRTAPQDLVELCPSGFRRVPISTGCWKYPTSKPDCRLWDGWRPESALNAPPTRQRNWMLK